MHQNEGNIYEVELWLSHPRDVVEEVEDVEDEESHVSTSLRMYKGRKSIMTITPLMIFLISQGNKGRQSMNSTILMKR